MSLTLVLGPANSAKAGEVLGAFADAARRDALLVVPTAADAEHYTRELAAERALLGSVLTFSGLMAEVGRRTGVQARQITSLTRRRLLRRLLGELELPLLAGGEAGPGLAGAAAELVTELERELVTPQRFTQALRAWARVDPRRGRYAEEVGRVYWAYSDQLRRLGVLDRETLAWRALDALRRQPGAWGVTPVFLYGFDDLLAIERDAVETLARLVGAKVTVSLTVEAGRAALSARAEVVAELRAIASTVRELPALDEYYAPRSRRALHHLERSLFEPAPARIAPGDAVQLREAGGELAEAELVAAEVVSLLEEGYAPEEVAVVRRSMFRGEPLLAEVLGNYGVPTAGEHHVPLPHTPLGRGVRALARCAWAAEEAGAGDLLTVLRTPGLAELEAVDALEADLRRGGLRELDAALARWSREVPGLQRLRDTADPAGELGAQARALLLTGRSGSGRILATREERDAHALAALGDALTELTELGQPVEPHELLELLEEIEVRAGEPPRPGAVLLAEPLTIRARRFRAVIVCGLNEGEFPAVGRGEPFLSDAHRRELAACAGLRLPPREDPLPRERYLFYACLSRATERVVLSYRSSDEEGGVALPSPFVADVADLFEETWRGHRRQRLLADVVWGPAAAPTQRERERALAAATGAVGMSGAPSRSLGSGALQHVRHTRMVSPGALERYAECPVRWFVESQLEPARLEAEPEPLTRGSFMHSVLEAVLKGLGGEPLTPRTLPQALEIMRTAVAAGGEEIAPARTPAVRRAVVRGLEADLERYLRAEAEDGCEWAPGHLEVRFGFDGEAEEESLPPVELGEGGERVLLRGVIDRVDVEPGEGRKAIVRDYKSGSARGDQPGARWRADHRLQVPLYMVAVRQHLGLEPVGGFYQPLRGHQLRPRGMFVAGEPVGERAMGQDARQPQQVQEELAAAEAEAVALAAAIRRGALEPCPGTCSRDGCRYPGICRSS